MSSVPPNTPQSNDNPQPIGGWPGFAASLVRVINGMTSEKMLLVTVVAGFGYVTFTNINSQHEREAMWSRQSDESRERDRRHCDDREDRIRKEAQLEQEKMRVWYTQMADTQRRFESEERARTRLAIDELTKAVMRWQPKDKIDCLLPLYHRTLHHDYRPGGTRRPFPVIGLAPQYDPRTGNG